MCKTALIPHLTLLCNQFGPQAGGITHTNPSAKESISFNLTLTATDSLMPVDVTIVENIIPSVFFYSGFFVNAVEPDTAAPSSAPVALEMSDEPSSTPTAAPVEPVTPVVAGHLWLMRAHCPGSHEVARHRWHFRRIGGCSNPPAF